VALLPHGKLVPQASFHKHSATTRWNSLSDLLNFIRRSPLYFEVSSLQLNNQSLNGAQATGVNCLLSYICFDMSCTLRVNAVLFAQTYLHKHMIHIYVQAYMIPHIRAVIYDHAYMITHMGAIIYEHSYTCSHI